MKSVQKVYRNGAQIADWGWVKPELLQGRLLRPELSVRMIQGQRVL